MLLSYINEILQYSVAHSTYLCFVECCRSKVNILKFVIGSYIGIWSHLLKKSLMENFIFCAVLRSIPNSS